MNEFARILADRGGEAGLHFTARQLEQFTLYYELLIRTNAVMNLTAITEPAEVAVKHVIDSLLAYDEKIFPGKSLADGGSGAGFPGLPLKIYCPSLRVVLLDASQKRLRFLEQVIEALRLEETACEHLRAEEAGRDGRFREAFDLVTARAVARLNVLLEYCLPLVRQGGLFIALKGGRAQAELEESAAALRLLGGTLDSLVPVKLPGLEDGRALVRIRKSRATPARYPRRAGIPEKNPLGNK